MVQLSALSLLMAWCYGTMLSVATILTPSLLQWTNFMPSYCINGKNIDELKLYIEENNLVI